jgi:hypothetical protein
MKFLQACFFYTKRRFAPIAMLNNREVRSTFAKHSPEGHSLQCNILPLSFRSIKEFIIL